MAEVSQVREKRLRLAGTKAGDHPVGLHDPQPAQQLDLPGSIHAPAHSPRVAPPMPSGTGRLPSLRRRPPICKISVTVALYNPSQTVHRDAWERNEGGAGR